MLCTLRIVFTWIREFWHRANELLFNKVWSVVILVQYVDLDSRGVLQSLSTGGQGEGLKLRTHDYAINQAFAYFFLLSEFFLLNTQVTFFHLTLKHLTPQNMKQLFTNCFHTSQKNSACYLWPSMYREALISLSVQGLLALNPSGFIIYFEEVLRLLVDPGALQLVDHISCENLV